jgi:quinol-cytochrome oxidoreductase complex cytochrome b subunit
MLANILNWLDERTGLKEKIRLKKELPIPKHLNFFYCFGGLSLIIIVLQVLTGIFMLFFYAPKPGDSTKSIEYLTNEVTLGWLFYNMHRWGATLLLALVFSHMISVFYHKAFQRPRELTWMSGVLQLVVVFLFIVTGIFLPWDWRAYWSFSIWLDYFATWPVIGLYLQNLFLDTFTLGRGFITHIWILPIVLLILLYFHFRMVKRNGISGPL